MVSQPCYDFCFIGAGIANLYAAYTMLKKDPSAKVVILEKAARIGGRVSTGMIGNVKILRGAGVGRWEKDVNLKRLLTELGLKPTKVPFHVEYLLAKQKTLITQSLTRLRKSAETDLDRSKETFREFGTRILGPLKYKQFVTAIGYSDYENTDVIDALKNYGFEDNFQNGNHIFYVPWDDLLNKLTESIDPVNILTKVAVTGLMQDPTGAWTVHAASKKFTAKNVVIGTTIKTVRKLVPKLPIYKEINSQPFLRVYARLGHLPPNPITAYTVVDNRLQKIIPIKDNVYMVVYSDNENALHLNKNPSEIMKLLKETFGPEVKVEKMVSAFWQEGTHYYTPLKPVYKHREDFIKIAQHPAKNLYVVGEAVSLNQGWVEGALRSTHVLW